MSLMLCADDFAQNHKISLGILYLLEQGRVQASSCMVGSLLFKDYAPYLLTLRESHGIQIGLHLNLTHQDEIVRPCSPLFSPRSLPKLLWQTHTTLKKPEAIEQEIKRQIELFLEMTGGVLDFIDGHQHVHQLPRIRSMLLKAYGTHFPGRKVWIRSARPRLHLRAGARCMAKEWALQILGGNAFLRALRKEDIPHNENFDGVQMFDQHKPRSDLQRIMERNKDISCVGRVHADLTPPVGCFVQFPAKTFLKRIYHFLRNSLCNWHKSFLHLKPNGHEHTLVMCHPAFSQDFDRSALEHAPMTKRAFMEVYGEDLAKDPICAFREKEIEVLLKAGET